MTYELALQLEKANFPYDENRLYPTNQPVGQMYPMIRVPPLSELIKACGEKLTILIHEKNALGELKWSAGTPNVSKDSYNHTSYYVGDYPDEAVALLYIALNKK